MIPRNKKISKKDGILKKTSEKRDFEKEQIDFKEVKEKIIWFDQDMFDVLAQEDL